MPKTYNLETSQPERQSVLASLRAVVPERPLLFSEALRLAELQASRLLELTDVSCWPVPSEVVSELPRIRLGYTDLPTSGMSHWDGHAWAIVLNEYEPPTRQRFTLLHEFKHIVDHGRADRLYRGNHRVSAEQQAEQAADYFAGCVLMPKRFLKRAWGQGLQHPERLAEQFEVSPRAIEVRLTQLGLRGPRGRCAPPSTVGPGSDPRLGRYYRALSANWPVQASTAVTHPKGTVNVRA